MACRPDGQTDSYLTLARYKVLDAQLHGDTVDGAAEVVTVAEERGDPNAAHRYVTQVRVRTDTLHWKLVRDSVGRWGVCGYSREGYDFGHYGDESNTRWVPRQGTWDRVRRLADSVHRSP